APGRKQRRAAADRGLRRADRRQPGGLRGGVFRRLLRLRDAARIRAGHHRVRGLVNARPAGRGRLSPMAMTQLAPSAVSSAIRIVEVTMLDGFDAMRTEWNQLVDRLPVPSPFQTWEWNRAWWNHFGEERALLILEFRQAGRLIGIAPFFRHRLGTRALGLSMLLPLGWEGNGLANGLTEQWELLFPAEHRTALLETLAGWLQVHPWSTVLIPGFAEREPLPDWMARRIAYRGKGVVFDYRRVPADWGALVFSLNMGARANARLYPPVMPRR